VAAPTFENGLLHGAAITPLQLQQLCPAARTPNADKYAWDVSVRV
jgi:hypothetical protein